MERRGTFEMEMTIPFPRSRERARRPGEVAAGAGRWVVDTPKGLRAYRKRAFARQAARYWQFWPIEPDPNLSPIPGPDFLPLAPADE